MAGDKGKEKAHGSDSDTDWSNCVSPDKSTLPPPPSSVSSFPPLPASSSSFSPPPPALSLTLPASTSIEAYYQTTIKKGALEDTKTALTHKISQLEAQLAEVNMQIARANFTINCAPPHVKKHVSNMINHPPGQLSKNLSLARYKLICYLQLIVKGVVWSSMSDPDGVKAIQSRLQLHKKNITQQEFDTHLQYLSHLSEQKTTNYLKLPVQHANNMQKAFYAIFQPTELYSFDQIEEGKSQPASAQKIIYLSTREYSTYERLNQLKNAYFFYPIDLFRINVLIERSKMFLRICYRIGAFKTTFQRPSIENIFEILDHTITTSFNNDKFVIIETEIGKGLVIK